MGLGNNNADGRTFLSVAFGKIRQKQLENREKVTSETPKAVMRKTQSGQESWAIEYDFIEGTIQNIFYREDKEYGNSFEVVIRDAADLFQLSFSENSRFWTDFARKLPNIDFNIPIKITAYDFTDSERKRRIGISVEQDGIKIQSFYHEQKDDKIIAINGFPSGDDINFNDNDELKVFYIQVKKFLREEFNKRIAHNFESKNETQPTSEREYTEDFPPPPNEEDDIPF